LLLVVVALVGCRKKAPALLVDAAPPPAFARAAGTDAGIQIDELWRQALAGDPLDLAALADREGALNLMTGVDQGGEIGLAALHAVPFADDAELAMRRLGEIALQTEGDTQRDVLDAIVRIAARPASTRDALDAPGVRACADALLVIAGKRGSARRDNRALAVSALRSLAERLGADAGAIPTDLDSP
jgi:hypothetical protein